MKRIPLCTKAIVLHAFALLVSSSLAAQTKPNFFHDPGAYVDFQFFKSDMPLVTTQVWVYGKKTYAEARYNYEDRQTASLYLGRVFYIGKHDELQIIPMAGYSIGRFTGISPAATMILEAGWIRGFSQSQYSINTKEKESNFFFNWTAVVIHIYKPLFIGASSQSFVPQHTDSQLFNGPMISCKIKSLTVEGFAYNFWNDNTMWALGLQYNF